MAATERRHRVLLVRPWGQQGGGGCCGAVDGPIGDGHSAPRSRHPDEEAMGAVYRALVSELPASAVDVQLVDPRNWVFLVPALVRDARARGYGWVEACRQLLRGSGQCSIVVDGCAVSSWPLPDPHEAVSLVLRELAAATR